MRFSREMIGLPVIYINNGRELGKAKEWLLDEREENVVALVTEGGGWLPQRLIFPYRAILSVGTDAILVQEEGLPAFGDPPELEHQHTFRVLGKRMFSANGREVGIVDDFLFEETSGRVTGWRLSSGLIDDLLKGRSVVEQALQLKIGEDVLILGD